MGPAPGSPESPAGPPEGAERAGGTRRCPARRPSSVGHPPGPAWSTAAEEARGPPRLHLRPQLPTVPTGPPIVRLSPQPPAAPGHWLAPSRESPPSRQTQAEHLQGQESHRGWGTLAELGCSLGPRGNGDLPPLLPEGSRDRATDGHTRHTDSKLYELPDGNILEPGPRQEGPQHQETVSPSVLTLIVTP